VYRYGAIFGLMGISYVFTILVTSELFLPVFYRLAITSTYEVYRYGAIFGLMGISYVFTILVTSELFLPVFYRLAITSTYEGGLKAVVWTDVFQVGVMLAGFLAVIIRHTFWTLTVGGTFVWVSVYGINQAQVQRYLSCKTVAHARLCDPWTTGQVTAPDQLMPYLVMDIMKNYPGVPGLFVAAAYSGSFSTVSSSINSLAAVTVEDLIKPHIQLSEKQLSWTSKGLSLLYGALCIAMTVISSQMGGVLQIYPAPPEMSRPLELSTVGCNFSSSSAGGFNWSTTAQPPPPPPPPH
ncbi:hypothetical protein CRUP_028579, partial [Coryphaenoides rupestris]